MARPFRSRQSEEYLPRSRAPTRNYAISRSHHSRASFVPAVRDRRAGFGGAACGGEDAGLRDDDLSDGLLRADAMLCSFGAGSAARRSRRPAPHRSNIEFAALGQHDFSVLYALPAAARRLVPREAAQGAHTLPRLAATCIQLI